MNGFSTLKPHSKGLEHSDFTASLPFYVLISGQRGGRCLFDNNNNNFIFF